MAIAAIRSFPEASEYSAAVSREPILSLGWQVSPGAKKLSIKSRYRRYLDFMDNFLAPGETCHPSDNIGSLLTAAEYSDASGKDLIAAIAIAYQVECRLTEEAPVMSSGFDHTTQLSF